MWLRPQPTTPNAGGRRAGRTFRLVCIAAPILVLTILGIGAATAPTVLAANVYYLHNPSGAYTMDSIPTNGTPAKFQMDNPGVTQTWASTVAYTGQTVPAGSYTFTYWTSGEGGATVTAILTSTSMPAVLLPASSYLCWQVTVVAVDKGGLDLRYDASNQQTSIATPSIVVPEHGSPLIGLAILLPLLAGQLIRKPLRAKAKIR
ncbi:MAG: hypothetical protein E6I43_14020 [Chloroflexi bacterium]|nr:MAG: hypothetical protein E6I43_14020 [Chloroflexota bacterium]